MYCILYICEYILFFKKQTTVEKKNANSLIYIKKIKYLSATFKLDVNLLTWVAKSLMIKIGISYKSYSIHIHKINT